MNWQNREIYEKYLDNLVSNANMHLEHGYYVPVKSIADVE
jgi:hypothetical protein